MKSRSLHKVLTIVITLGMLIGYLPISASAQSSTTHNEIVLESNPLAGVGDYSGSHLITRASNPMITIPTQLRGLPFNKGNIKAKINALDQCDIKPTPAEKAIIFFYQNDQEVGVTTTDKDGYFSYALEPGNYDVEILMSGYVTQMINDVVVTTDEDIVLDDINLRLDAACLFLDPESIYQEQFANLVTEQTITITNTGAKESPFVITGKDLGGPPLFSPTADVVNLILDDGSYENALGVGGGSDFITVNRFTPAAEQFPIALTEVSLYFEGSTVATGNPFKVVIYQNTSGNSDPAIGSELLYQQEATIGAVPGWTVVTLDQPVVLDGPGDVLIGGLFTHKPGVAYYPASIDQTSSQQRSWAGYWSSDNAPSSPFLPPDHTWALIDSLGFAGNWMIRAKGGNDILWLDIDPKADVIEPDGGQVDVTLTFNSTGLFWGVYFGELQVANTPAPKINIPVQLRVLPFNLQYQYLPLIHNR